MEMVTWKACWKDRKLLQNSTNVLEYIAQSISVFAFAFEIKSSLSDRLVDELHEPFEHLILHVIMNTAVNKNRSTVYIWYYGEETDIFNCLCNSEEI